MGNKTQLTPCLIVKDTSETACAKAGASIGEGLRYLRNTRRVGAVNASTYDFPLQVSFTLYSLAPSYIFQ
jgi:hypothetical protein